LSVCTIGLQIGLDLCVPLNCVRFVAPVPVNRVRARFPGYGGDQMAGIAPQYLKTRQSVLERKKTVVQPPFACTAQRMGFTGVLRVLVDIDR